MARPKNPYGDPVSVCRKGERFRVRYYPTGEITDPKDRKELPSTYSSRDTALEAAALLRQRLLEHRDVHGTRGDHTRILLADAINVYQRFLDEAVAAHTMPQGTADCRFSDVRLHLGPLTQRSAPRVRDLVGPMAKDVVASISTALTRDGRPKALNTQSRAESSLRTFGRWLIDQGYAIEDPFGFMDEDIATKAAARRARIRVRAYEKLASETYSGDGDDERGIGLKDVPSLSVVSQLRDAIYAVETLGIEGLRAHHRLLSPEAASQTSQQPMFQVATGMRLGETLVVHTSRIDLDDMTIGVDRQIDVYRPWYPGDAPPMVPPKNDRPRRVNVWPFFEPVLRQLVEYADEHSGGWLFPAPSRQLWRTKARESEWKRAIHYMGTLRQRALDSGVAPDDAPAVWIWRPHYTRHTYGSYSLAPVQSGGLGWSTKAVQMSMGHADERTTLAIYRHVTNEEFRHVRTATIQWPGL